MIRRQTGAVLVMVAILIVVMIAVAALALDVGRLLVLRSEMHNAVDAVALAAAAELNGNQGAQERAREAAKTLLEHDSHFAKVHELLGASLNQDEIKFTFFCAIENNAGAGASNLEEECKGGEIGDESIDSDKYKSLGDADSHYVRVTLNPVVTQGDDQGRYSIDLYFLPVLRAIGLDVPTQASTTATAVAGRAVRLCEYPPLMICNPYETSGSLTVGQQIRLFMGSGNPEYWVPGDFGLLEPPTGGSGATDVSKFLAGPGISCTDPYITTKTGVNANMVKWGLNTRFGIYEHSYQPKDYPPAKNVLDYPLDKNLIDNPNERVGTGIWELSPGAYWSAYTHTSAMPSGLHTRYEYYKWEIDNNDYPTKASAPAASSQCNPIAHGCDKNTEIWKGEPNPSIYPSDIYRRVITVPVLNCSTLPKAGGKISDLWVADKTIWKKFFITNHVDDPASTGNLQILAEYLGEVGDNDGTYRVEVKLYE